MRIRCTGVALVPVPEENIDYTLDGEAMVVAFQPIDKGLLGIRFEIEIPQDRREDQGWLVGHEYILAIIDAPHEGQEAEEPENEDPVGHE